MRNKENYTDQKQDDIQKQLAKFNINRYCNLSRRQKNLWGVGTFFKTLGALSGFSNIIDKHTPDINQKLNTEQKQRSEMLERLKWQAITVLTKSEQTLQGEFYNVGNSIIASVNEENKRLKMKLDDDLHILNYSAIMSILFLYIISFVLLTFVKWN